MAAVLPSQGLGETGNRSLGPRIHRHVGLADAARFRDDVDDAARLAPDHAWQHGAAAVHGAVNVEVHDLGPVHHGGVHEGGCAATFFAALGKKVVHYYTRPFGCEFDANLPAYALPAASDEGDLSVQSEFHGITFECFV